MRFARFLPGNQKEWLWLSLRLLAITALLGYSLYFSVYVPPPPTPNRLPFQGKEEQDLARRLRGHVHQLATRIGQRNIWTPGSMEATTLYILTTLANQGHTPIQQEFEAYQQQILNIGVEIPGQWAPEEILVIGAHYDTVVHSPGADDNASGVAVLLELARLMRSETPQRTIRLVAFANEEPPFYFSDEMGSRHYARSCKEHGEKIVAMLSLETMGHYSDTLNSQHYPFPLGLFYPNTGNFLAFVGNLPSRPLLHRAINTFRQQAAIPSQGLAAPGMITGIAWSDHWSFWQEGYPGIMLTDTAFFRSSLYHTAGDTEETLDYDRLARVVGGLLHTVLTLADQSAP